MNDMPADEPDDSATAAEPERMPGDRGVPPADGQPAGPRPRWRKAAVVVAGAAVAAAGAVLAALAVKRGSPGDDSHGTATDLLNYDGDDDYDDYDDGEALSVWDASDTWLSSGMDEDYTFGYSEFELRRAAGFD